MSEIPESTIAYLGGFGTSDQQDLFTRAARTIDEAYTIQYPDSPEDREGMVADQYVGAAMYALEDATLEGLAQERSRTQTAYLEALDTLRGACVAAVEAGTPKIHVAASAGVTRRTLDKWLGV